MRIEQNNNVSEIPHDVRDITCKDLFLGSLSGEGSVTPVNGGVAHRVYQISHGSDSYYLKIRGNRFASIPSISCDPHDIDHEHTALQRFGAVVPTIVPHVYSFNPDKHYLILSDVIGDGQKMEDILDHDGVPEKLFRQYGATLRTIHDATKDIQDSIRPGGDTEYYQRVLGHRFGSLNHPILNALMSELSSMPRQLILADFAPKNIGVPVKSKLLTVFDLETAHQGNAVFDFGYAFAHVILHTIDDPSMMAQAIQNFLEGYGTQHTFDPNLVKKIIHGILLYRLNSVIPYATRLTEEQKSKLEIDILKQLNKPDQDSLWNFNQPLFS